MQPGVIIVGAGQGGFQAAASLREEGYAGALTLIGDEPGVPYQRPPLSKGFLTGKTMPQQLELRPAAFYADKGITLLQGERVTRIVRQERHVQLASGRSLPYEHLVLATGSLPRMPRAPGVDLQGVLSLRTAADAVALLERLRKGAKLVVVGAGFIGLEVAVVARELGLQVDVLEFTDRALQRSASALTASYLAGALAARGASFHFGEGAETFVGEGGEVRAVLTTSGKRFDADLVVVGIGVEADDALAREAALAVDCGVVVDENLVTSDAAISAIGDCARFPAEHFAHPIRIESVQNAVDQARCVAARIAGKPSPYRKVPWFWSDQGENRLQIAGVAEVSDDAVLRGSASDGKFSVLRFRHGRLTAVESINNAADHMAARKLLAGNVVLTPEQAADPGIKLASLAVPT